MNDFLALLFLSREIAHREHLATNSYSQHKALGHFYEDIVDLVDSLAEAYQGRYGIVKDIPIMADVKGLKDSQTPAEKLELILDQIERTRYDALNKEETAMQNIVDEIVALFLSTLYKLKELS